MPNIYFFRKKINKIFTKYLVKPVSFIANIVKITFSAKTLMIVTASGIRSVRINSVSQIIIIFVISLMINLFNQSLSFNEIIEAKSQQIKQLEASNNFFKEEFNSINHKLMKINDYLLSNDESEVYKVNFSHEIDANSIKKNQVESISKEELQTFNEIEKSNQYISQFHNYANVRSEKIASAISSTGLKINSKVIAKNSVKKQKNEIIDKNNQAMGGPLISLSNAEYLKLISKKSQDYSQIFLSDLNRLVSLEKIFQAIPFGKPMKNFRITSGFGYRKDPITRGHALHQGLDFVGLNKAKIISPSSGKVIHAGALGDYGNIVIIDHGFGITTRYGHLSEVKVKVNQKVAKGQIIATQGSTGRSTGQHLHYEVRYKNNPLNPRRFIEAGDKIINHENSRFIKS